ncbi:hypothetical protein [Streptomyces cyaneofuscatus]
MNSRVTRIFVGIVAVSSMLIAGCTMSDSSEKSSLKRRAGAEVEAEIKGRSSEVMDIMATKGKVTEPGPYSAECADEGQGGRVIRHPWSLYGVSNDRLEKAMENLLAGLPKRGWKIVESGTDGSKNQNQQILAVHLNTHTQMDVRWKKGLDTNRPIITVNVYSRCFVDTSQSQ